MIRNRQKLIRKRRTPQTNDFEMLKKIEENNKKLEIIKELIDCNRLYDRIKFNNVFYAIGDAVMIQSSPNKSPLIGRIVRIIPIQGNDRYPYWPTIEVEWYLFEYYNKDHIELRSNGITSDEDNNSLSDYELFKTQHKEVVFVEQIISHCSILTFEEYEKIEEPENNIFFSRASYNFQTKVLNPPFSSWPKECVCMTPLNPDHLYIKCDSCDKWYHPEHCGLKDTKVEEINDFFCPNCRSNIK